MELINLSVLSSYKNLQNINIKFDPKESTYVLIGNNGSGKSSVLEALSSIFSTLYDYTKTEFEFDFNLVYKINGKKISLTQKNNSVKVKIDGLDSSLNNLRSEYLPSRVICNYSGEETRIKEKYFAPAFNDYIGRLKSAGGANTLNMVFIDKEIWPIILLIMLVCRDNWERFKHFIDDTLQLRALESVYIDIDRKQLQGWSDNPVTYYIRRIVNKVSADGKLDIADINSNGEDPIVLFNLWNSARPLISDLKIRFNGDIDSMMLSEGEKKLMVVLFILEVVADENALVLLDEPDSHIHVARKTELKEFFDNLTNRKNILTSHSPTLTAKFPRKSIIMLDRLSDGRAAVVDKTKQEIVERLTNGIWTIQEQNIFLASNKTILIVEGKTDEQILSEALKSLQKNGFYQDFEFCYLPAGGASNIPVIDDKFIPKPGQLMIALFDCDKAGVEALRQIFSDNNIDKQNFGKARKKGSIWYSFYPSCKKNVADFNIEDYFPRAVFLRYVMQFKGLKTICSESKLKSQMADDCAKGRMTDKQLSKFKYVFERIQEIIIAANRGQENI